MTDNVTNELFWTPIRDLLETDDDITLWTLAVDDVVNDLNSDLRFISTGPLRRLHLMIAKQSHWWRPHWPVPVMYGSQVYGMGDYQPPDWQLHWFRKNPSDPWEYRGTSSVQEKRYKVHCLTFLPGHTAKHSKVSVVQIWRPPISPGMPITFRKYRDLSWYPDGRRLVYARDKGVWKRIA